MQIETLELTSRDLTAMEDFYGRQLGLAAQRDTGTLTITAGKSKLVFHQDQEHLDALHKELEDTTKQPKRNQIEPSDKTSYFTATRTY